MALDAYETIFERFQSVSDDTWKNKIIKDLKGKSYDELIWHSNEGIDVLPFYSKENTAKYQLAIPAKSTKDWQITAKIIVQNIKTANEESLTALQNGANALVFDLNNTSFSSEEIKQLLQDIQTDIIAITFNNVNQELITILEGYVKNGCYNIIKVNNNNNNSIVDQLVDALQQFENIDSQHFHFLINKNYFFEIAKLRAFRWLWNQLCLLKQIENKLFLQCETSLEYIDTTDEYSNILRNTTAAMSAVLGGCDSLIINSYDAKSKNSDFGKRIAINIQHILWHEAHFNELHDAAKGSYYIEYLTYQFCEKAWNIYNEK